MRVKRETEERERYCEMMDQLRLAILNRLITTEIGTDSESEEEGLVRFSVLKNTNKRIAKVTD